jgi:hypothetical protein
MFHWKKRITPIIVLALSCIHCAGSARDDSHGTNGDAGMLGDILFIRQINADIASGGPSCVVDNSPTSLFLLRGRLDVALRTHYDATLLVGFQSQSDAGGHQGPGVALQEVTARLEDTTGQVVWGPVSVPVSGFVDTPAPTGVSYGITEATLIGTDFGVTLAEALQAEPSLVRHFKSVVRVSGRTSDGATLESDEWSFPIEACYHCLIVYPVDASDPKLVKQPNCDLSPPTGIGFVRPCRPGQDDEVDCRVCKELLPTSPLCEP